MMAAVTCQEEAGDSIERDDVGTPEQCCEACSDNAPCVSWSFQDGVCSIKRSCVHLLHADDAVVSGFPNVSRMPVPEGGRFPVAKGFFNVDGYRCASTEGHDNLTAIFYPVGEGPFHVVVYAHGQWGELDELDSLLETVASMGLIVVAPFALGHHGDDEGEDCGNTFVYDMLLAIRASRNGAALHPALGCADFSRTGLFGQSAGAKYLFLAAHRGGHLHIKALLASHDVAQHQYDLSIPAMFTTGTADDKKPPAVIRAYFDAYPGPKVFANLVGGGHMEARKGKRMNRLDAQFLACHVAEHNASCEAIYGHAEDSLCNANEYAPDGCIIANASSNVLIS